MTELSLEAGPLAFRLAIPEAVAIAAIVATWRGGGSLALVLLTEKRRAS